MIPSFVPPATRSSVAPRFAVRRMLLAEDAWLLRRIGSHRPVLWLRPQPIGRSRRHGMMSLRVSGDGHLRGKVRARFDAWPWPDDSIPRVVLQHVVDGSRWSQGLLAEAARVLEPEGRLYVLRYDRSSPWYWRYGRAVVRRTGARTLIWPLDALWVHRFGLSLEYQHALGPHGFRAAGAGGDGAPAGGDRWPLSSAFRPTRIWVLRKRTEHLLLSPSRSGAPIGRGHYGLAPARRSHLDQGR